MRVAGQVRIVGGAWRRRLLPVASGPGVPAGLRPTPDRVRETLFNWLGQDLGGWHCVDLCAGTGALGLEAASRGAASVLLLEQHAALVRQLRDLKALQNADTVQVRQGDALAVLRELARRPASIDLLLQAPGRPDCYVEVKNVTAAVEGGVGYFPDAVTARGAKHLRELAAMVAAGHRAVLVFCVQRGDVAEVRPADHIDPAYGRALRDALAAGVEVLALGATVTPQAIALTRRLAVTVP